VRHNIEAMAASGVDTGPWNPVAYRLRPRIETADTYAALYGVYRRSYPALRDDMHLLARRSV
jgi:xylulokinase